MQQGASLRVYFFVQKGPAFGISEIIKKPAHLSCTRPRSKGIHSKKSVVRIKWFVLPRQQHVLACQTQQHSQESELFRNTLRAIINMQNGRIFLASY